MYHERIMNESCLHHVTFDAGTKTILLPLLQFAPLLFHALSSIMSFIPFQLTIHIDSDNFKNSHE